MGRSHRLQVELVSAGVDWLTMTMRPEHDSNMTWLLKAVGHINRISKLGYQLQERHMLGYDGISAGNCFVGQREDGSMAQFTGYHADGVFTDLYREECSIPRIDLQVTCKFNVMPPNIAKEAYKDASNTNGGLPVHRRRKLYIIVGSDGGDTFYCGSPSSDQRGRLYNKEVQSEDPMYSRSWRYEVAYRNDRAKVVASTISTSVGSRASTVRDITSNWWQRRGVDCTYFQTGARDPIPLFRTLPTDIERKLQWLRTQVRPTIKLLVELGMYEEVAEALELSTYNSALKATEGGQE